MFYYVIDLLFQTYTVMIFVRILSSWLTGLQSNRFIQFIGFYTDPYLNIFRKFIPPLGMIDISPVVAFFALSLLKNICLSML
jgi:YggT family protein